MMLKTELVKKKTYIKRIHPCPCSISNLVIVAAWLSVDWLVRLQEIGGAQLPVVFFTLVLRVGPDPENCRAFHAVNTWLGTLVYAIVLLISCQLIFPFFGKKIWPCFYILQNVYFLVPNNQSLPRPIDYVVSVIDWMIYPGPQVDWQTHTHVHTQFLLNWGIKICVSVSVSVSALT